MRARSLPYSWRVAFMFLLSLWSFALIWFSLRSGPQHDYLGYIGQWDLVIHGENPWASDNAYGPLHNLVGSAIIFGPLYPKFIMVTALAIANAFLAHELWKVHRNIYSFMIHTIAISTNFLIVVMVFRYGLNDSLVAAFVIFAVLARSRGFLFSSGCALGLAILLKYYPAFLVPFFALDNGRFSWRLPLGTIVVTAIGFLITIFLWGSGLLVADLIRACSRAQTPIALGLLL